MTILKASAWAVLALCALLASDGLRAQNLDEASALLEAAIQKQVLAGDLAGAAAQYEIILARFGDQRRITGQALWRLAQCQEQLGQLDKARQNYERIVREHADQVALVRAAQVRLAALLDVEDWNERDLSRQVVVDPLLRPDTPEAPRDPGCCRPLVFSDLSVFNRQTGESRRLTNSARAAAYPVLSPTGQLVAYLSWNGDMKEAILADEGGRARTNRGSELRIVGINGSGDRAVLQSADIRWLRPIQWSPDGAFIVTLFERTNGLRQIAMVGVADGSVRVLKSLPWLSVQDMGFSPDGQFLAYQVSAPRDSQEMDLFVLPVGRSGASVERRFSLSLAGQRGARVTDDDLVIHVLNRLGFGPRPGDIERVKAIGVDAYIDQQLHPEQLADPVVDEKLAGFTSLQMSTPQVLETLGPLVDVAQRRRATIFERSDMAGQPAAERKPDPGQAAARTSADPIVTQPATRPGDYEVQNARLVRAMYSTRQLNEVLVDFWMNHFNVNLGDHQLAANFEERAIRRNAFGRFEDLLSAVAHDPRMLFYLDNWRSSAPKDVMDQRMAETRKSGDTDAQVAVLERLHAFRGDKGSKGLNENFGRELLELHTVGVDAGYTQQDVIAVARILSGWTIGARGVAGAHEDDGVFVFDPLMHIDGDKLVMGQTFKSGGVEEGEQLLKFLAHHPATARHIATKLARRFIADDPPAAVVDNASRAFLRTGGDIREVVRTIITSPEFRSPETIRAKIKKPLELVASALRALDANVDVLVDPPPGLVLAGNQSLVSRMGERVYTHEAPDGNPDVGSAWMNSNALLLRLDFANRLATERIPGVKINLAAAERLLTQVGIPKPTPLQIEQTRGMLQAAMASSAPAMGGQQMMMGGGAGAGGPSAPISTQALTVAAMLGSPQFQKR